MNVSNVTTLSIGMSKASVWAISSSTTFDSTPRQPQFVTPTEPDATNLVGSWAFDGDLTDGSGNGRNGATVGDGITFRERRQLAARS